MFAKVVPPNDDFCQMNMAGGEHPGHGWFTGILPHELGPSNLQRRIVHEARLFV
jgi:hypothetical protein